jgi:porphobilinogen deaminase
VAQAREMIDLSIHSQKDVLEALQQRQAEGAT